MAIQVSNDINKSWLGETGGNVHNYIKDQFTTNVNAINNSITKITFTGDQNNSSKINVDIYRGGNAEVIDGDHVSFTITPKSEKTVWLTYLTSSNYVAPGDNLQIEYGFRVKDDSGSYLGGYRVTPKVTVNDNPVYGISLSVGSSNYNAERRERITIPASYFTNGINTITINKLEAKDKEDSSELGFESEGDNFLTVYCVNLNLDCDLKYKSDLTDFYTKLVDSATTELTLVLKLKSGDLNLLTAGFDDLNIKYKIIGGQTNLLPVNNYNNLTLNSQNTTKDFTISGINEGFTVSDNTQQIYVLAYMEKNGITVLSNVVKFLVVINNNINSNSVYYIYKLLETYNSIGLNYPSTQNYIKVNQYDNYTFEYYAYSELLITLEHSLGNKQLDPQEIRAGLPPVKVLKTLKIDFDVNTTFSVKKQGDPVLGLNIQVIPVKQGGNTVKPAGAILDLTTNGTNENTQWNDVNYIGFNGSTNGYINNSLIFSDNSKITFNNFKPCSTLGEHSISFRFKTSNESFENEELIKCFSSNCDGFIIYPQKAVLYNGGGDPVETEFSSEDSIKEITFVWYGDFYNNYSIVYVNGTAQKINESSRAINNNGLVITANKSILHLYRIISYNRALTFKEVLNLYATENLDSENINKYTIANSIFSEEITNTEYNGNKVTIDSLPIGSTYMLIKAHPLGQDRPWEVINNLNAYLEDGTLTKSLRILVGPIYLIKKVAPNLPASEFNFYADKGTFSAQGTSSMNYDIKNFRIYFNKKITDVDKPGFGDCYSGWNNGNEWSDIEIEGWKKYTDGSFGKTSKLIIGSNVVSHTLIPSGESVDPKKYSMRSTSIPADIFCLKADVAESSGVHNTGFARLANYVMENSSSILNSEHSELPQNRTYDVGDTIPTYKSRLTIDGFPIYLFFADKQGNIYYHGKYNFNNEKATADIYGFTPYNEVSAYFDNETVKNQVNLLKPYFGLTNNDTSIEDTHETYKDSEENTVVNMIECWEFSTNLIEVEQGNEKIVGQIDLESQFEKAAQIPAFCYPYTDMSDPLYQNQTTRLLFPYCNAGLAFQDKNPFKVKVKGSDNLAWINTELAWEYRFPDWETKEVDINDKDYPKYRPYLLHKTGQVKPYLLESLYKWIHRHSYYLWENVANNVVKGESNVEEFARLLPLYFNVNNLLKYYVLTKWFLNSDQRIKNCMLSFYCDPDSTFNTGEIPGTEGSPMGNMRAYFLFYDNDTILGLTNDGKLQLSWDGGENGTNFQGYDSQGKPFNGIWCNLEYCYNAYMNGTSTQTIRDLGKLIVDTYLVLRRLLPDDRIDFFLDGTIDITNLLGLPDSTLYLPDSASNIDMEIKYMFPKVLRPEGGTNFDSANLKRFQGNRKYHRERFLRKRTRWFDSLFGGEQILNLYYFSIQAASATTYLLSGVVKFTCGLDNQRFYFRSGDTASYNAISDVSNNLKTILNSNTIAQVSLGSAIPNSNGMYFGGLYACKEIDMSQLNGQINVETGEDVYDNAFLLYSGGYGTKPLSLLEKITIGTTSTRIKNELNVPIKSFYTSDFLANLFVPGFMPNILTIIVNNVETNNPTIQTIDNVTTIIPGKFNAINLEGLNNLSNLTLNTYISGLTLPNQDSLTNVYIKSISGLFNLENVFKLSPNNLTIDDFTNLNSITLTNCSVELYIWALNTFLNKRITINFGWVKGRQTIDSLLSVLNNFTDEDFLNLTLSGYADYEDNTYGALVSRLKSKYYDNHLSIISKSNIIGERIDTSSVLQIKEGEEILLTAVDFNVITGSNETYRWEIISSGLDESYLNRLRLTNKTDSSCKLIADLTNNNTGFSGAIEIRAYKSLNDYVSAFINVNYTAIDKIQLTTLNNILNSNEFASINIELIGKEGSNTTKSYLLLDSNKWETSNCTLNNAELTGYIVADADTLVKLSLKDDSSIEGKIELYYNEELLNSTIDTGLETNYPWLFNLLGTIGLQYLNGEPITRKKLNEFSIKTANSRITAYLGSVETGSILSVEGGIENYDLLRLSYFKNFNNKFTVPSAFSFTNINIPNGFTEVEWLSIADESKIDNDSYSRFVFPKTVNKVNVNLQGLPKLFPNLNFDISRTDINKIYPYNLDSATNVFYLLMSMADTKSPSSAGNTLFTYNNNVDYIQIGNYKQDLNNISNSSPTLLPAIFSLPHLPARGANAVKTSHYRFYSFGNPPNKSNNLYIGVMTDYICNTPIFTWSDVAIKVKGLYGTFTADYPVEDINFKNLEYIGDLTFAFGQYLAPAEQSYRYIFEKSNLMTEMGSCAFLGFSGKIIGPTVNNDVAEFNLLRTIPTYAFGNLKKSHTLKFLSVTNIKALAFNSTSFGHNIYIDNEYNMTLASNSAATNPFRDPQYNILYTRNRTRFVDYFGNYANTNLIEIQ